VLILDLCERVSDDEANAKVAVEVLRKEIRCVSFLLRNSLIPNYSRYGEPTGQMAAAKVCV
jgi:hypothetical protein